MTPTRRLYCLFESVLRLLVSPQVHFPLEALSAQVAAERFEARVFPAVCDQVGALAEGLPAHLTLVRLLALRDKSKRSLVGFVFMCMMQTCLAVFLFYQHWIMDHFFFYDSYLCG